MQVVILCSAEQEKEFISNDNSAGVVCVNEWEELLRHKNAAVVIDLLFEMDERRILLLQSLSPATIIVNSVIYPLQNIHPSFIRINGWPTFLSSVLIEGAGLDVEKKQEAETAFSFLGKKIEWVPDVPGFVTPRIISTIINEAYFALGDGVSTKEEIDTAMKLGTAYPFGPFEWSKKLGLKNVVGLLQTLSVTQGRYAPAGLLLQETDAVV